MKGRSPLAISKHSTANAKYLFPVRRTFVATTFPEPIFLISPCHNNFVSINAKGIDPIRQKTIINKKLVTKDIISIFNQYI